MSGLLENKNISIFANHDPQSEPRRKVFFTYVPLCMYGKILCPQHSKNG